MSLQINGVNDYINVSRGLVVGASRMQKAGYNPAVGATESTVWSEGTTAVSYATTATLVTVSSTSAADTSAGTGATAVVITGLDANFNVVTETITMNGTSAVTSTKSYFRITLLNVSATGTAAKNVGTVYAGVNTVTNGKPATIYNAIAPGFARSASAFTTIPGGMTGYLLRFFGSADDGAGTGIVLTKMYTRPAGGSFFTVVRIFAGDGLDTEYQLPLGLAAGTDIEIRTSVDTGTATVTAEFELLQITPS